MSTLITGLKRSYRRGGVPRTLQAAVSWATYRVQTAAGVERDALQRRRAILARELDRELGSVVRYGPFAGLRLAASSWGSDRASMLLGFYEKEILDLFADLPERTDILVDLGAADGYYAIGAVVGGVVGRSICFEIEPAGREAIAANATANGVAEKIAIHGRAEADFAELLSPEERARSVVLIDIEGAEFALLSPAVFAAMGEAMFVIEVHRWAEDGKSGLDRLIEDAAATHAPTVVRTGPRDLSSYPELEELPDNDRWLLCSEGRRRLGTWLVLTPRAKA